MTGFQILLDRLTAAERAFSADVDLVLATKHGTAAYRAAEARLNISRAVRDELRSIVDAVTPVGL